MHRLIKIVILSYHIYEPKKIYYMNKFYPVLIVFAGELTTCFKSIIQKRKVK